MDSEYGAVYRDLYRRHWWWRARRSLILQRLERLAPAGGFGPILDIGCGDGLFLDDLARYGEPEGLEPDTDLVSEGSRNRHRIHLRPFDDTFDPGRRFGLITALDVVEHLDDDVGALAHARRLLAPGGVLLVTVPALPALWTRHDDMNHHRRRYTARSLTAAATAAGLEDPRVRYFFHWLTAPKLAVAALERLTPAPEKLEPPRVPPAPLNGAAYAVTRLEQATWGRLPWPAGSSLLMVA